MAIRVTVSNDLDAEDWGLENLTDQEVIEAVLDDLAAFLQDAGWSVDREE